MVSRPGHRLYVLYVDRGPQRPEFLWWDGQVAPDESFHARQSAHQLFDEIVAAARRDRDFDVGRYARNGRWLLVETALDGRDSVDRPLVVTLVIYLSKGSDRLTAAADQATRVLREQELPRPAYPIQETLDQAEWKSRGWFGRFIGRLLGQAPNRRGSHLVYNGEMLPERNTMGQIPRLNSRLVVLDRDDYVRAKTTNPELLADEFTTVVPVPLRSPWTDLEPLRLISTELKPGTIFVRNRFEKDHYVEVSDAYERIAMSKFSEFAYICQLLGARSLQVEELREFSETGEQTGSVNFQVGPAGGGGIAGSRELRKVAQYIREGWTWATGKPDRELAEQVAVHSGLGTDPMINNLLRQRGHTANPLIKYDLVLDISSEAQSEISFALKLEPYLSNDLIKAKFAGKFERLKKESRNLQLTLSVEFA